MNAHAYINSRLGLRADADFSATLNAIDRAKQETRQLRSEVSAMKNRIEDAEGESEKLRQRIEERKPQARMEDFNEAVRAVKEQNGVTWKEAWNHCSKTPPHSDLLAAIMEANPRPTGNNGAGNLPRTDQTAIDSFMAGVRKEMKNRGVSFAKAYETQQILNRAGYEAILGGRR